METISTCARGKEILKFLLSVLLSFALKQKIVAFLISLLYDTSVCFNFMQINKAKRICESLIASDGTDLKFEEAFCLFLLGLVCDYDLDSNYWCCHHKVFRYFLNLGFLQLFIFLRFSNFLRESRNNSTTQFFTNVVFNLGPQGLRQLKS